MTHVAPLGTPLAAAVAVDDIPYGVDCAVEDFFWLLGVFGATGRAGSELKGGDLDIGGSGRSNTE